MDLGLRPRVVSTTQPTHGNVTCGELGGCLVSMTSGYVGEDSFRYTITDDRGSTSSAVVTLSVSESDAPTENAATDDQVTAPAGTTVRFDVTANDTVTDGDVAIVSVPTRGTAACNGQGACSYASAESSGWDVFTYRLGGESGPVASVRVRLVPTSSGATPSLDTPGKAASGQVFQTGVGLVAPGGADHDGATATQRPLVLTGGPGLTFGDVATAKGWTSAPGADGSVELTPGSDALLGNSRTVLVPPPLPPISQGTGGDGHVPILVGTKVFAFFHHANPTSVSCVDRQSGALCPGYPKRLPISADNAPGPGVVVGSKILVKLSNYSGTQFAPIGLFCWDASTDQTCGMVVVDRTERPTTTTFPVRVGNRAFFAAGTGLLYCVELDALQPCEDAPVRFSATDRGVLDIDAHNDRVNIAGSESTYCITASTGLPCSGWGAGRDLGGSNLVTMRNDAGSPNGICGIGSTLQCLADDSDDVEDLGAWLPGTPPYTTTGESTIGTRTFVGIYGSPGLGCFDWESRSLCAGDNFASGRASESSDGASLPSAYGTATDGACIVGLGDPGKVFTMDERGNSPCTSVSRGGDGLNADLRSQRCDATVGAARWSAVEVDGTELGDEGDFISFVVTARDAMTLDVVATGELVGGEPRLDLSDVDPQLHPDLTVDISAQQSQDGAAWEDGIGPRVTLTWAADQKVGCVETVVTAACPASAATTASVTDGVEPKVTKTIAIDVPSCGTVTTSSAPSTTVVSTTSSSTTIPTEVEAATDNRSNSSGTPLAVTGSTVLRPLALALVIVGAGLMLIAAGLPRRRRDR